MSVEPIKTIRTKVIATLGPASDQPRMLRRLIGAGVDVMRLNFSHGSLEAHAESLRRVREVAAEMRAVVAVLGDLCGPKIRLGMVEEAEGGGAAVATGDTLIFQRAQIVGGKGRVSVNYERFVDEVAVGHRVLVEDGAVRFIVVEKTADELVCRCTSGGVVRSRKGVNLPDSAVTVSAITDYDRQCVAWAIEQKLDYLALSFVRGAEELQELRAMLTAAKADIHIIAKVEKPQAVRNIDAILEACDAVMVARGDLGVEVDLARVPVIQKRLIQKCRAAAKPVIVATQMLQSMVHSSSPTRAEVSDVANAIFDGTDAVMLSNETAVGDFPEEAVRAINHVAQETEEYLKAEGEARSMPVIHTREQDAALARGTWQIVDCLPVRLVVVFSGGGANARIFSKLRLPVPVVALTNHARTASRLAMYYGVIPHRVEVSEDLHVLLPRVDRILIENGHAQSGDTVLIVGALTQTDPPQSNAIMIHRIG